MEDKTIRCTFCQEALGTVVEDGQIFRVNRAEIYHRTVIFCTCGRRSWTFVPVDPPETDFTDDQIKSANKTRLELAHKNKGFRKTYEQ